MAHITVSFCVMFVWSCNVSVCCEYINMCKIEHCRVWSVEGMTVKPTVALRAIFVGGIAAFAKIAGAVKAAGGAKLGAAAVAVTAAAGATMSGPKQDSNQQTK